jgi:large subunit ribosomal protein L15
MKLSEMKNRPGAKHRRKRLGCGESSGHGKTSGKGNKGQKARSGAAIRVGFEGGQMPIYRRLPKKGFSNADFRVAYQVVNVSDLEERFSDGDEVTRESLLARGLATRNLPVKILADGDLSKKLTIRVNKVSASAKAKIEGCGGSIADA